MSKYYFHPSIPEMVLPKIKELLEPWEWIIPSWCDRIVIQ